MIQARPGSRAAVLDERTSGHAFPSASERRKAAVTERDPRERSEQSGTARAAPN
jgi:hypothetical protein